MPVQITSSQKDHYVLIEVSGTLENLEELKDLSHMLYAEALKYDEYNVIVDEMQVELTNSIVHQVELIKYYTENLPVEIKKYNLAVAVDPKYKEVADFWTLYGANRGFPWKGCTSLEEAVDWLRETRS